MGPETEAKALIALIIALIAFGCGSGAGIVMGLSQNGTSNTTKVDTTKEIPQIQNTKNVNTHTEQQVVSTPQNTNQPVNVNNGGSENKTTTNTTNQK